MSPRTVLSVAVVAALALVAPADAAALIRVNEGMAGVSLGQSQKRVTRELGRPSAVRRDRRFRHVDWTYRRKRLVVSFRERTRRVVFLLTHNRRERTATGVGVGSTEQEVTAGVSGARCLDDVGYRWCQVEGRRAITLFLIIRGRVESISIGAV